jgi:hypothetical protein
MKTLFIFVNFGTHIRYINILYPVQYSSTVLVQYITYYSPTVLFWF